MGIHGCREFTQDVHPVSLAQLSGSSPAENAIPVCYGPVARGCDLFMQQRLPVRRRRRGGTGVQRMRVPASSFGPAKGCASAIVVKPPFARLEARDDRVTRRRVMLRCM